MHSIEAVHCEKFQLKYMSACSKNLNNFEQIMDQNERKCVTNISFKYFEQKSFFKMNHFLIFNYSDQVKICEPGVVLPLGVQ